MWTPLWGSRVFHAVVYEEPEGREEEEAEAEPDVGPYSNDEDWLAHFCNKGETVDADLNEDEEGSVQCMKSGVEHGSYYEYVTGYDMSEGVTTTSGEYKAGKKHGIWSHSESFGNDWIGEYRHGKKQGLWRIESRDATTYEVNVNGSYEGTHWTISSGEEALEGYATQRVDFKANRRHGKYMLWNVDEERRVLDETGSYEAGEKHGIWTFYDEATGHPTKFISYKSGVLEGPYRYWHNSEIIAQGTITNGSGAWVKYTGKKLVESGMLKGQKKDGPWVEERGKGRYAMGKRVGKWVFQDSEGRSEGPFKNGMRTGVWTYYNEEEIIAKGLFVKGEPDGKWMAQADGGEVELLFKKGLLLKLDDEPVDSEQYEYTAESFAESARLWSIEDDGYPY